MKKDLTRKEILKLLKYGRISINDVRRHYNLPEVKLSDLESATFSQDVTIDIDYEDVTDKQLLIGQSDLH